MRFEEFSGEWQESKLSDIVKLFGGNAFSSSDSNSFGIPWLKIANIGKKGIDWSVSSYLPDEFWTSYKDYRLYKGDYVMALTRPILNHILKISIVDKKALLNQRVAKLIFSTNAEYGYQLLQRRSVVDKIENELAGTDPPNLGSGNLKNINISITLNKDEQSKIGNFFKQLDDTITFHQQELTTLKQTKLGFLQKMFPKEGESVPEVRFPGFTGEWEQRKFKDFISKAGKKNTMGENYSAYSVSNKLGLVSQTEQFNGNRLDNLDKASYKLVNPNEFAYNPARINVGSIAFNNLNKTVIVSSLYVVLKMSEELDNEFILQFIKSQFFIDEVRRNTEGSVREYLFFENFKNIKFPYTSSKDEQLKIGNFLKQLDDIIALHQCELDALKETKKAFLQKMFV